MNWTKIPTDLLVSRTPDIEILSIVKYQLLWAALERQPDDKTALRYLTPKQLTLAKEWYTPIMTQVVSDISSVETHRKHQKINYNKNKDLPKNLTVSLLPSLPHSLLPSLQEVDKTRIDYIERESKEKVSGSDNAISKDTSLVPASASNQEDLFGTDCSTYAGKNINQQRCLSTSSTDDDTFPDYLRNKYKWEGSVIKLVEKDFVAWQSLYPNIDLRRELENRDDWLSKQPEKIQKSWFLSTKKYLEKLNKEAA